MKKKDGPQAKAAAKKRAGRKADGAATGTAKPIKGRAARMAYKKALRAVVLDLFMPAVESVAAEFVRHGPTYKKALRAVVLDLFMPVVESVAAECVQRGPEKEQSK